MVISSLFFLEKKQQKRKRKENKNDKKKTKMQESSHPILNSISSSQIQSGQGFGLYFVLSSKSWLPQGWPHLPAFHQSLWCGQEKHSHKNCQSAHPPHTSNQTRSMWTSCCLAGLSNAWQQFSIPRESPAKRILRDCVGSSEGDPGRICLTSHSTGEFPAQWWQICSPTKKCPSFLCQAPRKAY